MAKGEASCNEIIAGNTVEETVYHEAGHIVAACALGLPLRPKGIIVYEVGDGVGDGYACYGEDEQPPEAVFMALLAGVKAQRTEFPGSWIGGATSDESKMRKIAEVHFQGRWHEVLDRLSPQVDELLREYWGAVAAVAESLLGAAWEPLEIGEDPNNKAKRKRQLPGDSLLSILKQHGILTHVA